MRRFSSDKEIAAALREAPAAKGLHHAWIGGLLEHMLSLMGLCDLAAGHYPTVNRDLLLTGVMLHDIGKLRELAWGTSFEYTLEGQLLGHITIGLGMIEKKIAAIPDFPASKRLLVEHLVLSHHGKYEFGSPKLPMTAEAIVLHYLDNLDAKMQTVRSELARAEASGRTGAGDDGVGALAGAAAAEHAGVSESEGSHGFEESAQKPATQEPAKSASENGNRQEEKQSCPTF